MVASFLRPDGDVAPIEQRSMIAALVGPMRAPFGAQRTIALNVVQTVAQQAASNAQGPGVLYVELLMLTAIGGRILVGPNPELNEGFASGYTMAAADRLSFLLYPSEALFIRDPTGAATNVLVTEVTV